MAVTSYGVNHPSAVKHWSHEVFKEALKKTYAAKFMGSSSESLLQVRNEMKTEGDRVTVHLRMQLSGAGIAGDGTLEGNEEQLTIYTDNVFIDQLRHAVRSGGRMSEQRVPFEVRDEAKDGLADWWADRLDTAFFNQITGNSGETDTRFTGLQAALAPDTNHAIIANSLHSTTASLSDSAGSRFNLQTIDRCIERAKTLTPAIRPVMIGGKEFYVCFIHPYQETDLRRAAASVSDMSWADIQRAAMEGGKISDNPIFTGALGVYNNTILHSSTRIPSAVANTRRAIFCGAQAAAIAFGKGAGPNTMTWVEELFDFENQLGVACGCIHGIKKMRFNSADFSTIAVTSYAAAH